jgi:hypothetical protein
MAGTESFKVANSLLDAQSRNCTTWEIGCRSGELQRCRVTERTALGNFVHIMEGIKYSGLNRKLLMDARDASMPGVPSYFTIRKNSVPVPTLGVFMTGYQKL